MSERRAVGRKEGTAQVSIYVDARRLLPCTRSPWFDFVVSDSDAPVPRFFPVAGPTVV